MLKKIKIIINNIKSENDIDHIEKEIDFLKGIKSVNISSNKKEVFIEFSDDLVSRENILNKIKKMGFFVDEYEDISLLQQYTYFIKGTHCASCEVLIEKKLLEISKIKSVDVSRDKVNILYEDKKPSISDLNKIFKKDGYVFSDQPISKKEKISREELLNSLGLAILAILIFLSLSKLGLGSLVNISSSSSLWMFLVLGLLAGCSSCAALIGGIVLSMSKQWQENYSSKKTLIGKSEPIVIFNLGRIISFAFFGFILGYLGSIIQISFFFTSALVIIVSLIMIVLALQMLGIELYRFSLPRQVLKFISIKDKDKEKGKSFPFLMGGATFFLPCGFTIAVQSLALISGNPIQSSLMLLFFALGTAPTLFLIGLSSVKFFSNNFLRVAGILVLFFAFYNINAQMNVFGLPSVNTAFSRFTADSDLPPIVNGKQIIKMNALAFDYQPNYFKVRAGIPVRWEITDAGVSGCTNAVISRGLFSGEIRIISGSTSVKEFTPKNPGRYTFSCWMGHISGIIEVISE